MTTPEHDTHTAEVWIACPYCGNPRLKRAHPDESAVRVYVFCRRCKREIQLTLGAIPEAKL